MLDFRPRKEFLRKYWARNVFNERYQWPSSCRGTILRLLDRSHVAGISRNVLSDNRADNSLKLPAFRVFWVFCLFASGLLRQGCDFLCAQGLIIDADVINQARPESAHVRICTTIRVKPAVAYCCGGPGSGMGSQGGVSMRRFSVKNISSDNTSNEQLLYASDKSLILQPNRQSRNIPWNNNLRGKTENAAWQSED
jgi:hypothetical protein